MANILSSIFKTAGATAGAAVGGAATAPISAVGAVVDGASKIIGMFKLSPEVKAQLQAQLTAENIDLEKAELAAQVAQMQGQLDANTAEAKSPNWFIAGARPAVMWVCVLALFWAYVVQPFTEFTLATFHYTLPVNLPHLDTGTLISGLLIPLLGLAGYRTIEKVTGTEGNRS